MTPKTEQNIGHAGQLLARHPSVDVDLDRLVLVVHGRYAYEVDLERCETPARALDYILQVSSKTWCSRELAGELLDAFDSACWLRFHNSAQGVFCPFGRSMAVDWLHGTTRPASRA